MDAVLFLIPTWGIHKREKWVVRCSKYRITVPEYPNSVHPKRWTTCDHPSISSIPGVHIRRVLMNLVPLLVLAKATLLVDETPIFHANYQIFIYCAYDLPIASPVMDL